MRTFAAVLLLCLTVSPAFPQHKVPLQRMNERLVCVVPMIGAGTPDDPRRPMFAPLPGAAPQRDGIIAFTYQESDDGQSAIVEFVARDASAFNGILRAGRSDVKAFRIGKHRKQDIEQEFRRHKRDFSLDRLEVGAL